MVKNAFAQLFYDQCAGTTAGHMANIPNNPVLFSMISAATGRSSSEFACSVEEFADLLSEISAQLKEFSNTLENED